MAFHRFPMIQSIPRIVPFHTQFHTHWFNFVPIFSIEFARVIVNFKDDQIFPAKVSPSNNFIGFIAIAGSLICLFMGASLLSIFELLYYFTVCMFIAYRKNKQIEPVARIEAIHFVSGNRNIQTPAPEPQGVFTYLPWILSFFRK